MPVPASVPRVTLTGNYTIPVSGADELAGTLMFTPIPSRLASEEHGVIMLGSDNTTLNASGAFSIQLVATDAADEDFVWRVDENITGLTPASYNISLPASASPVALASVAETETLPDTYTVITGPQGLQGAAGEGVTAHAAATTDVHGIADTSLLASLTDVDNRVETHNEDTLDVHGIPNTANLLTSAQAAAAYMPLTGDPVRGTRAVHKTADEPIDNNTLQDDNHLAISLTANAIYAMDMFLDIEGDGNGDFTMGWSVPSGTVMSWTESGPSAGNGNNIASIKYNRLGAGDSSGVGILPTGTVVTPSGNVRVGATGGTLTFRWAQTTTNATPTILKTGSWMRLHRIA